MNMTDNDLKCFVLSLIVSSCYHAGLGTIGMDDMDLIRNGGVEQSVIAPIK